MTNQTGFDYMAAKYPLGMEDDPSYLDYGLDLYSCNHKKHARNYQEIGVKFGLGFDYDQVRSTINSSVKLICGDQMRLGKTPQGLLIVKNLIRTGRAKKILYVVKNANLWQWINEHREWISPLPNGIWPIINGKKSLMPPGFSGYIISMDSLRNMVDILIREGFDTIVVDEAHSFKNDESARTIALIDIVKKSNILNRIFLTGTPILNRADEFYVMLHLCAEQLFPSWHSFRTNWLISNDKGKYTRVAPWKLKEFRETISTFYIRREKQDVYKDCPILDIQYTYTTIEEQHLKDLYNKELTRLEEATDGGEKISWRAVQDNIMLLRRITEYAKIKFVVDYVEEFMGESDHEKMAIGIHHKDVVQGLLLKLGPNAKAKGYGIITLDGKDNAEKKYHIMEHTMKEPHNRLLIINQLAGGVGMDFHYINTVVNQARQWNAATEEQFNFRFYNPDRSIKNVPTYIETIIAKGTIDEWWHDMIMEKAEIFKETVSNEWLEEGKGQEFLKDLVQTTIGARLK